jgi:uncharacterized lipoprotein
VDQEEPAGRHLEELAAVEKAVFACLAVFLLSACGKMPESETSKKIGEQPKQIIDKVTTDVDKAMQKNAEQMRDAEKKE